ncbi:MAG TPA: hypothetical protein IAA56_04530 [Candidatus Galloscillospira excrementavium]|nr:hypothetical protein [Candidatus Galloscillospira excrementavium]
MASEKKLWEVIREAGFDPLENGGIVVKYAADNLSEKIADFFNMEFYVLQLCKEELLLIPFSKLTLALNREVALEVPYDTIRSVDIAPDGLNYTITIHTGGEDIALTAQQKELSEFRSSGTLATGLGTLNVGVLGADGLHPSNWHRQNLDTVLEALGKLGR